MENNDIKSPPSGGFRGPLKAGIIGGAGYTGGELLRILVNHPYIDITFVHSKSNAGKPVYEIHTDLLGDTNLNFTSKFPSPLASGGGQEGAIDVLFLCVGHGDAKKFLEANAIDERIKIIDLSQDFRLTPNSKLQTRNFIYGLPELNRDSIKSAQNIANPGCFATCIELGLLPLAAKGLLKSEIHINATTGSTGAGQSLTLTSHFTWRDNNLSVYKAFEHQHLNEIVQSLAQLQKSFGSPSGAGGSGALNFIPQRGNFTRGILAAMYTESDLSLDEAEKLYEHFYASHPFTHISKKSINLKQVVNTNKAIIHLEKHGNKLFIVSSIDNLLKGASGQAVQNMNLMFGLDEMAGLRLIGSAF